MMRAAARMGWSESQFWQSTPRFFFNAWKAYEIERRETWELSRWSLAIMMQPHVKPGKHLKPLDIAKFPWDENEAPRLTKEQIEKMRSIWSNMVSDAATNK